MVINQLRLVLWLGLRYTRSRDKARFLSLLSWFSLIGMMLGVAALLIVLSVMNGFQQEIRERMLALTAHGQVEQHRQQALDDWQSIARQLQQHNGVLASAPMVGGDVMLTAGTVLRAAVLQGVDPQREAAISPIENYMLAGSLDHLALQPYSIVIGAAMARSMGVFVGDQLQLTLPQLTITPFGARPRVRRFVVAGIFEVGADVDASHVYVHIDDARRLYQLNADQAHAIRFVGDDVMQADALVARLRRDNALAGLEILSWSGQRQELFAAIRMEKRMVAFMLAMVIVVAACNLISLLSMMVADKRNEIAVLRMMGLGAGQVLLVFLTQGLSLSLVGIGIGLLVGLLLALWLSEIVSTLEAWLDVYLFDPGVYYVSGLPSQILAGDVLFVLLLSLLMSVLFSLYPAWRAARIQPVEALQYQ